jgi:hypothetical protein
MGFDNYYPNRKDKRRKYYKSAKKYSASCRNHGSCNYCRRNRLYQRLKEEEKAKSKIKEWEEGD